MHNLSERNQTAIIMVVLAIGAAITITVVGRLSDQDYYDNLEKELTIQKKYEGYYFPEQPER